MSRLMGNAPYFTLLITLATCLYIALQSPAIPIKDPIEVMMELCTFAICIFLLFKFQQIRQTYQVYPLLYVSASILIFGSGINITDEFFQTSSLIDTIEDIANVAGFFLFVIACIRWVNYHRQQLLHMQHLAEVDSLTGISNRRAFLKLTDEYFALNDSNNLHVSVLVVDVDHFKQINDSYGHQFGDKVLIQIANTIKLVLRQGDYVARIGGEEFVVLLKETDETQARFVAEKVRASVQRLKLEHHDNAFNCTVSIGIAASCGAAYTFDTLFNQADKAMYQAKSAGRNRCRLYR